MNVNNYKKIKSIFITLSIITLVLIFMHPLFLYVLLRIDYKCTKGIVTGVAYATEGDSGTEISFIVDDKKYKGSSNSNDEKKLKVGDSVLVIYYPNFPFFHTYSNSEFDPR